MANEGRLTYTFQISKGNLVYRPASRTFQFDVGEGTGPTPGGFLAALAGTVLDFSEITTPGMALITNLDDTNYIEWGMFDTPEFYPIGEVLPGESYVFRLSRYLGLSQGTGVGTGDIDSGAQFMIKATVAPCLVIVEAFGQ